MLQISRLVDSWNKLAKHKVGKELPIQVCWWTSSTHSIASTQEMTKCQLCFPKNAQTVIMNFLQTPMHVDFRWYAFWCVSLDAVYCCLFLTKCYPFLMTPAFMNITSFTWLHSEVKWYPTNCRLESVVAVEMHSWTFYFYFHFHPSWSQSWYHDLWGIY